MIPVNTPVIGDREKELVSQCLETGWISSEGNFIPLFEAAFAKYIGCKHGIAVSSGSAALDIVFDCLDLETGDEVILPTFTIISPAFSIVRAGGIPVLVDSDPLSWNIDVSKIREKITKRTKAICVVHTYGLPADMDPIRKLASEFKLLVIEDAAEMHGQTYREQKCGSLGDISIFSFYPNKHITTGEGGMILCNNAEIAARAREKRNLSFRPEGRRFIHDNFGWNFRMTNIQAAIGVAQLERIDSTIARKREIGMRYLRLLEPNENITLPQLETDYALNIFWVFGIIARNEDVARKLVDGLNERKIGNRPFFWCMHEQPVFRKRSLFTGEKYPVAEHMARCGFYIPSGLGLGDVEIEEVADVMNKLLKK